MPRAKILVSRLLDPSTIVITICSALFAASLVQGWARFMAAGC